MLYEDRKTIFYSVRFFFGYGFDIKVFRKLLKDAQKEKGKYLKFKNTLGQNFNFQP